MLLSPSPTTSCDPKEKGCLKQPKVCTLEDWLNMSELKTLVPTKHFGVFSKLNDHDEDRDGIPGYQSLTKVSSWNVRGLANHGRKSLVQKTRPLILI